MRLRKRNTLNEKKVSTAEEMGLLSIRFIDSYIGSGVFATGDLDKGQVVCFYNGDLISAKEGMKRFCSVTERIGSFLFFFRHKGKDFCIDGAHSTGYGRMINDSHLKPNCKVVVQEKDSVRLAIHTLRHIKRGEELRYDYNDNTSFWRRKNAQKKNIYPVPEIEEVEQSVSSTISVYTDKVVIGATDKKEPGSRSETGDTLEVLTGDTQEAVTGGAAQEIVEGNIQEANTGDTQKELTGDTQEVLTGDTQEVLTGDTQEVLTGDTQEVLTGDTQEVLTGDTQEVLTGDTQEVLTGDTQEVLTGDTQEVWTGETQEVWTGETQEVLTGDTQEVWTGETQEVWTGETQEVWTGETQEVLTGDTQEVLTGDTQEVWTGETQEVWTGETQEVLTGDTQEVLTGDTQEVLTGDMQEVLTGDAQEVLTGDMQEVLTGDMQEVLTGDAQEVLTGDSQKVLTGDTQELLTGETQEVLTGDAQEVLTGDMQEVLTGDAQEVLTGDTQEVLTGDTQEVLTGDAQEVLTGDTQEVLTGDAQEVLTGDTQEVLTTDTQEVLTGESQEVLTGDTQEVLTTDTQEVLTGDAQEVLTGDTQEVLTGDAQEVLTGDTQEVLTTDTQEVLTGESQEVLIGETQEVLTGDTQEVLTGDTQEVLAGDTQELLTGESQEVWTGETQEVLTGDAQEVLTGESQEVLTTDTQEVLTGDTQEVLIGETQEVLTGDTQEVLTGDAQEVLTTDTQEVLTGDTQAVLTGDTKEVLTTDTPEVLTGNTQEVLTGDTQEVLPGNTQEVLTGDTQKTVTGDTLETTGSTYETVFEHIAEAVISQKIAGDMQETLAAVTSETVVESMMKSAEGTSKGIEIGDASKIAHEVGGATSTVAEETSLELSVEMLEDQSLDDSFEEDFLDDSLNDPDYKSEDSYSSDTSVDETQPKKKFSSRAGDVNCKKINHDSELKLPYTMYTEKEMSEYVSDSDASSDIVPVLDFSKHLLNESLNDLHMDWHPQSSTADLDGNSSALKQTKRNVCDSVKLLPKGKIKEGCKQVYDKMNYCVFCGKAVSSKISRHLLSVHKDEPRVSRLQTLEKRSQERMIGLEVLANEGNFKHNVRVIKEKKGFLVVGRRESKVREYAADDYLPCQYCKKFIMKETLWLHEKNCKVFLLTCKDGQSAAPKNPVKSARMLLHSALMDNPDTFLSQLLSRMHSDEITEVVRDDVLIRWFAALKVESLGSQEDQKINDMHRVSQCCRTLARLIIECKKVDLSSIINLDKLISPERFDLVVGVTKSMCTGKENSAISLGKFMGNNLKHAIQTKKGMALRNNDNTKLQEAENFQKLFESEWNYRINSVCQKKMNIVNRQKVRTIPLTEDLQMLRCHLLTSIQNAEKSLNENGTPEYWTRLAKLTLCRLILFNKRRRAEVKDLKVREYMNRPKWSEEQRGEFDMVLSPSDRLLAERMDMVICAGKSHKNVDAYVILPPDAKNAINLLIATRDAVGVPKSNSYIFARLNADTPLSGNTDLRAVVAECSGLRQPDRITSTGLRRYIGTVAQILDMTDSELDSLARHLGHDPKTHKENYRLSHSTRELTVVSQLLIAVENGHVNQFKNRQLSDIRVDELPDVDDVPSGPGGDFVGESDDVMMTETQTFTQEASSASCEESGDGMMTETPTLSREPSTASRGKRKRWSRTEEVFLRKKFKRYLGSVGGSVHNSDLIEAQETCEELSKRSLAQMRTKLNNMKLGKSQ